MYCEELLREFTDAQSIAKHLATYRTPASTLGYCRLSGAQFAVDQGGQDAPKAWENLIHKYAAFRQDRAPGNPRPGRSYWPEPDAIRRVTKQAAPMHQAKHQDGIWFPRAAFGLPIITKFNTKENGHGDPDPQVQLLPNVGTGERWPSPLILKVIRLVTGEVVKVALVLGQRFPERLKLLQGKVEHNLPATACPFAKSKYQLKAKNGFKPDQPIYKALFEALNLKELQ